MPPKAAALPPPPPPPVSPAPLPAQPPAGGRTLYAVSGSFKLVGVVAAAINTVALAAALAAKAGVPASQASVIVSDSVRRQLLQAGGASVAYTIDTVSMSASSGVTSALASVSVGDLASAGVPASVSLVVLVPPSAAALPAPPPAPLSASSTSPASSPIATGPVAAGAACGAAVGAALCLLCARRRLRHGAAARPGSWERKLWERAVHPGVAGHGERDELPIGVFAVRPPSAGPLLHGPPEGLEPGPACPVFISFRFSEARSEAEELQAALLRRGCRAFACAFGETQLQVGDQWVRPRPRAAPAASA